MRPVRRVPIKNVGPGVSISQSGATIYGRGFLGNIGKTALGAAKAAAPEMAKAAIEAGAKAAISHIKSAKTHAASRDEAEFLTSKAPALIAEAKRNHARHAGIVESVPVNGDGVYVSSVGKGVAPKRKSKKEASKPAFMQLAEALKG